MIRMMCGVRAVDRVSTDVLRDRVSDEKIEDNNSKPSAVVWLCHSSRHQLPSTSGYGA